MAVLGFPPLRKNGMRKSGMGMSFGVCTIAEFLGTGRTCCCCSCALWMEANSGWNHGFVLSKSLVSSLMMGSMP